MGFSYQQQQPPKPKGTPYGNDVLGGYVQPPSTAYGNDTFSVNVGQPQNWQTGGNVQAAQPVQATRMDDLFAGSGIGANQERDWTLPMGNSVAPITGAGGNTQPEDGRQGLFSPEGLNAFMRTGIENFGIGQQPPTYEQLVAQYEAAQKAGSAGNIQIKPAVYSPAGVPTIGAAPQAQAGQVNAPGAIRAPVASAAQVDLGDAGQFQKALFESIYRPVDRELENQLNSQNRTARGQLANAGLGGSGVEQAVLGQIRDENSRQRAAALFDASNQATVQRFGYEFQTKLFNAQNEQQTRLANAGFDIQAQIATAGNILQAGIANAQFQTQASIANAGNATQTNIAQGQLAGQIGMQNAQLGLQAQISNNQLGLQQQQLQSQTYFNLLGLSIEQGQSATNDFLKLLQLGTGDLQHLDNLDYNLLSTFLNTYLNEIGVVVNAGTGQGSKGSGSSSGFDVGLPTGGGGGGTRVATPTI